MQFEDREQRNERPKEASRNLPMVVLLVLVSIICALLYIGWKYMSDDTSTADDLTAAPADTVANAIKVQPTDEETEAEEQTASEALPEISVPTVGNKEQASKPADETDAKKEKTKEEKPKEDKKVSIPTGGETYTHTVGEGETFFGIANRFNVKKETLKAMNPGVEENGIKVGVTRLKVRIKAVHTVGPGDILRVVGTKYDVPVNLIMQANKKTKNFAERGEKLIIPYPTKE
ncbi:LysM peptidoglycan-binding domain-containing protein [Emticicia sp. 21SJ11W-3]|uniref:LysM peptidoglycan-binding domain-containing protein n=1 Tax=Emticicia sp. 21SJ11W-3 TaxID=2916755 RepID=UPI00209D8504|nr:LysM peptidoglycan-binding domain-containing protein [Emticicia sp. 21SJ11W-3]UTA66245.1 LysM peptidoglycan-binding domain-containing protein [Emticicia sp. 21SJ11W-3]